MSTIHIHTVETVKEFGDAGLSEHYVMQLNPHALGLIAIALEHAALTMKEPSQRMLMGNLSNELEELLSQSEDGEQTDPSGPFDNATARELEGTPWRWATKSEQLLAAWQRDGLMVVLDHTV